MRWQGRNLRAGLSGSDVAELHDELASLGYQVPEAERAQRLFGVGTANAVAAFQTAHGMVETAIVDKNTAALLDRAAAETQTTVIPVQPQVGRASVSRSPAPEPPHGTASPKPGTSPITGDSPVGPVGTPPVVPGPLPVLPKPVIPTPTVRVVPPGVGVATRLTGTAFSDRGDRPEAVTLRFYTAQFGGRKTLIGQAVTGPDGSYKLDIGNNVDLSRVEVYSVAPDGTEHRLGGDPANRVDPSVPVNVVVPTTQLPTARAEYTRLIASVRPHLHGGALGEARENQKQRDLSQLHEVTGWDGRLLALGATAEKLAASTGISAQVAYGLLRAGLPTDPVQLARISPTGVGHALRKVVEAGVVALDDNEIASAQATLDTFGRTTRRKLVADGTASSYGSMLNATGLTPVEQDRFDDIFSAHTGDAASLWQQAQDAGLPVDQLKLTAQLGALTLNSARLTETLRVEAGSPEQLAETLVGGKLYQPTAWADRLTSLAGGNERVLAQMIPTAYQGETVAQRLAAYTADLAFKVRRNYPTQVLGDRVRSGALALPEAGPTVVQDVATMLDRAARVGFVPGQRPLSQFLSEQSETLFAGLSQERTRAATAEVATLTRQYQITASDEALTVLRRHDLRSAAQISAMPQRVFLTRYGGEFPTKAEAELTWSRAQQVTAVTLNLITLTKQLDSARPLPAMAQPDERVRSTQADLVKQFPVLESLFGTMDYCECDHCRSVLSPAAYLVDLLKFLDDAPALPKSPYVALTERRPDLPHLQLTCENTNTSLPYIDVVNEILEFYLAHNAQLTPAAAYDTGDASSEDLIAEPQNLLPEAYELLKQAKYPLAAPFDLWLTTVRAFLGHFEVPFAEVLEVLRRSDELNPDSGYGLAAVAYEHLGSSPAELALLTAADPVATWPARYGYASNASRDVWGALASARTLARALAVSYRELVSLLKTRFVNPQLGQADGNPLVLTDPPGADTCSWEQTTLCHRDGSSAEPIDYLLLNYFVRVWRRLGWTMDETDEALTTFLPTSPDPRTGSTIGPATASALLGVSRLIQLAELLNASPADRRELLVLWSQLSERRYAELFLTGTAQTRDPAFEGIPGAYLTTTGVFLAEHRDAVLAALRLSGADTDLILRHADQDLADVKLTMDTVSLLHRHAVLARLLNVAIPDLLALMDLTGLNPFTPLATAPVTTAAGDHPYQQTIRFVETVRRLEASGLTATDMDFLVRHRFDPVGPLRAPTHPPLPLVRTLAAEVTRIHAEYAIPGDPLTFTDDAVAQSLARVLDAPVAAAFLAAWTGRAPLPKKIFQEHLRRHVITGVGEVGFLDSDDLTVLFTSPGTHQSADAARRAHLAQKLLPYIQQRLTRRAVVEAVAAACDADPALVEPLLTDPALLDDPDGPGTALLDGYLAAATYGLTVTSDKITGYLELPPGHYRFAARCAAAGTAVALTFDHMSDPVLTATSTADDPAPAADVELRGGMAYGFTLTRTAGAVVTLTVRGQRLTTTDVSDLTTYPRTQTDRLHRHHLVLTKVLRLASALTFTEAELRYLLTHPGDFDGLDLGALPTTEDLTPGPAATRFGQLMRIISYARLRDDLAADPADLLEIFTHARRRVPDGAGPTVVASEVFAKVTDLTARMTRREPDAVRTAARLLGFTATASGDTAVAAGFTDEQGLSRLWKILALAARIGVGPAKLGRWATPSPDQTVAQDVQGTVKAKYSAEQWRRVAQPIFDKLRRQRRDALVAQVLQITGYERAEQLFEHFLVDPATEPVVQTSRLRLAISSVQTFIQRCLLNLENDVNPSSINVDYWEWMKRYRVWEANRKIFLWPENWLEPEFRDDKTHLYAALESALVESDLDRDAVETAIFGYLQGLEEIARLDIRTIYLERKSDWRASVLHVVGRTSGSPHKYFYRTWSHRSWSPWTPVTAHIDGDHLTVVVWQGRVHLFWVVFLPKPEPKEQSSDHPAGETPWSTVAGLRPKQMQQVQLFWSCYTPAGAGPGVWSDPKLAKAEVPLVQEVKREAEQEAETDFDPAQVFIWADVLEDRAVSVSLLGQGIDQSFRVVSKHAPPKHTAMARIPLEPPYRSTNDARLARAGQGRWSGAAPKFQSYVEGGASSDQGTTPCDDTETIFASAPSHYQLVIVPPSAQTGSNGRASRQLPNRAEDPFFYLDSAHSFFVEPTWVELSIPNGEQIVMTQSPVLHQFDQVEYWKNRSVVATFPTHINPVRLPGVVIGDIPVRKTVDTIIQQGTVIKYDGGLVGTKGRLTNPGQVLPTGAYGTPIRTRPS